MNEGTQQGTEVTLTPRGIRRLIIPSLRGDYVPCPHCQALGPEDWFTDTRTITRAALLSTVSFCDIHRAWGYQ